MSKVLFAFVFGLAACVPLATTASAQSRLGPSEDDAPTVRSGAARPETKNDAAKVATPAARPPKNEATADKPKGDAAKSEAQKTPTVLTSSAASSIDTNATPNATSDAAPKTTNGPLPVFGSPSVLGIPAPPKYEPPAPLKSSGAASVTTTTTGAPVAELPAAAATSSTLP
ncbi:MAG TPA: hypothetical protein VGB61_03665, partial [Pyrinomonadaceae bacterium]